MGQIRTAATVAAGEWTFRDSLDGGPRFISCGVPPSDGGALGSSCVEDVVTCVPDGGGGDAEVRRCEGTLALLP